MNLIGMPFIVALLLTPPRGQLHPEWGPEPPVAPYSDDPLPDQYVVDPIIFPVVGPCRWRDDYDAERGGFKHTGIDIDAAKMTPIVAPFGGIIGLKRDSFWIYADNGWVTLGTHLNSDDPGTHDRRGLKDFMFAPEIKPNQRVVAGQLIGYVGMSGDATGPHLHFELYVPGTERIQDRIRNPYPSLKHAIHLKTPEAVIPDPYDRPTGDETRYIGCVRGVDFDYGFVTLLLTAKQFPGGKAIAVTSPRYVRFKMGEAALSDLDGLNALKDLASTSQISLYATPTNKGHTALVATSAIIDTPNP